MAPRHRSFKLDPPPDREDFPTFELSGFTTTRQEPWAETFACWPVAPAAILEDLTQTITIDPLSGRRRYSVPNCMGFMRQVVHTDDLERFETLMRDPDRAVALVELVHVTSWLSEILTTRPTRPSSGFTPGGGTPTDGVVTSEAVAV